MQKFETMDGNQAAAYASYALTEVAAIYPITPSTPMAESVDEWTSHGRKNIFGQEVKVVEMQSEAGAAGAMHGSLQAGALTTTYTAAQGLLLMIPNLYKMVGELLPGVFHVSARALATHALSIFGDHQDVMACRQTGAAMLASSNVQEVMDMACIAHLAAIKSRVPFIHFFDGFRTSHEYQKISVLDYGDIEKLADREAIKQFRERALNPEHPVARGTAQNPDIYFQGREAANPFFAALPQTVEFYMEALSRQTGRKYRPFNYYGAADAEYVIVAMGSVCDTVDETVDYLMRRGEKVGSVKVHLYRPFSARHLRAVIPPSVKKIAVLDRTKEPGAPGEPLYLDVSRVFCGTPGSPLVIGGRYGLGSKDTRPSQILAVLDNLKQPNPQDRFTIGIVDDVTHHSLPEKDLLETTPPGTISCKFWGLGSDGTVGANKSAIKIIGDNTDQYVQGYFSYDSKKSGGTTISHLRFGKEPIRSPYLIYSADYIACHNKAFLNNYDILKGLKKGGTFVLNCDWNVGELSVKLPAAVKRYLSQNGIQFYIIDALSIAADIGLGNRINMIMQAAFFRLANVIPFADAIRYLKQSIEKTYGRKGQQIVDMNKTAVDRSLGALVKVDIPPDWTNAAESESGIAILNSTAKNSTNSTVAEPDFVRTIQRKMERQEGDELPVSAFSGREDGTFPLGTAAYEKRGIAVLIPQWQIEKCIQCGQCSYICPHATIRPFLLNDEETKAAPESFASKPAIGNELQGLRYRIQVSPLDCTGCANCADICPAKGKALIMAPAEQEIRREAGNWEHALTLSPKDGIMSPGTLKGSQFIKPLLEFNGACPGCGETPYIKLLTQLFGDRMLIANATGCSSIWGASAPSIPYTVNGEDKGPAWANSLFEDNAEYGYGLLLGTQQRREYLAVLAEKIVNTPDIEAQIREPFQQWLENFHDGEGSKAAARSILAALPKYAAGHEAGEHELIRQALERKDALIKKSVWCIGGDGWAYDIGYGGVDHVLASGKDINLFVLDTEVYSNTGGQSSKSTPTAAVAKFAAAGKRTGKKDLGMMAMSYGYVYVAQISMGANMNQAIKAIGEAEAYPGPSLVIAYSPCINHGIKTGMGTSIAEEKKAVEAGYWQLYRFDPRLREQGKNPFQLDSGEPKTPYKDFILGEIRYSQLKTVFPDIAERMYDEAASHAKARYETYKWLAGTKDSEK